MSIIRLATLMPLVASNDQPRQIGLASLFMCDYQAHKSDTTHTNASRHAYRVIEANLIILCGCLIFLRQFFRFHAPRLMGNRSSNNRSSEGSSHFGQLASSPDISWSRKRWFSFSQWYHREDVPVNTQGDRPEMMSHYQEAQLYDVV